MIELIKKQEAQSKMTLTDAERELVSAFFEDREREKTAFDTVILKEYRENTAIDTNKNRLREDVASPDADRRSVLALSPDNDGAFVRVPKTL